jgi:hypothetical protein
MKSNLLLGILCCLLAGCAGNTNNVLLELEVLNSEIVSLDTDSNHTSDRDEKYLKKSRTILTYKLTNNTDKTYCFIPLRASSLTVPIQFLPTWNGGIFFTGTKNDTIPINYKLGPGSSCQVETLRILNNVSTNLDYKIRGDEKDQIDRERFFIHPNEVLFFEYAINLPLGSEYSNGVDFEKDKYRAQIFIHSDSTNYKSKLSRTDLQTIKTNNYQIFNGIIYSKNRVPVKIIAANE